MPFLLLPFLCWLAPRKTVLEGSPVVGIMRVHELKAACLKLPSAPVSLTVRHYDTLH